MATKQLSDANVLALIDKNNVKMKTQIQNDITAANSDTESRIATLESSTVIGSDTDYGIFSMSCPISLDGLYYFTNTVASNNIVLEADGSIKLKANKTYKITLDFLIDTVNSYASLCIFNKTGNYSLRSTKRGTWNNVTSSTDYGPLPIIFKPEVDTYICAKCIAISQTTVTLSSAGIVVEEVGKTIVIDPLSVIDGHIPDYIMFRNNAQQTIPVDNYTLKTKMALGSVLTSSGTMEYSLSNNYVVLKANKTYKISASTLISGAATKITYKLMNYDTGAEDMYYGEGRVTSPSYNSALNDVPIINAIYKPLVDTKICLFVYDNAVTSSIYGTMLVIEELAQPMVTEYTKEISNPLTNDTSSNECPVGTVIAYMGKTPPSHYLTCDGTIYTISVYKELADFIKAEYGSYNFFGGDGITTFAVPDMRGEFLRGYGTKGYGTSGAIGVHQDPTKHFRTWLGGDGKLMLIGDTEDNPSQVDNTIAANKTLEKYKVYTHSAESSMGTTDNWNYYTARPTNMAVLYCIKYEPTYYAVNQYGGFETEVLFNGSINTANGTITLSDNYTNYDFLLIECQIATKREMLINTNSIASGTYYGFNNFWDASNYASANFRFPATNQLLYIENKYAGFGMVSGPAITKVVGMKGQLPTLMYGGLA